MVEEYFKRIALDAEGSLQLFADGAVVYQPFIAEEGGLGLRGKEQIRYFRRQLKWQTVDL
ncbi:hypothetical protein [Candidatus Nitrososphaera evergladensis]|uniref:hypothetical protein n=1 Tax=Candidatus Nitrososphaera evergladensis TaxID=1459637 RepID=UPI0011E60330|nr:hypothetical protein [Candidatus Nitrososphaera evergladensis]